MIFVEILRFAVELGLDRLTEVDAVVDVHRVVAVDDDLDFVGRSGGHADQEQFAALQGGIGDRFDLCGIYHVLVFFVG